MAERLYREESLQRVKSPDALNEYIRVARPSTWLVLGAIVLFLVGICVWGVFGRITLQVEGPSLIENGKIWVLVDQKDIDRVQPGMEIRIGESKGEVEIIYPEISTLGEICDYYGIYTGSYDRGQYVGVVEGTMRIADGSYDCAIVLQSIAPVSLLTN